MQLENELSYDYTLWEKRVFSDDYMTADPRTFDPVLSRVTCAAVEDTGWFKCNYDYTGPMNWGKNKGCGFLEERCFIRDQPITNYFCTE
jgi:leishmanolysin-like peptidase